MELEVVIGGQNEEILTKVSGFVAGFSGFLLMKKKKKCFCPEDQFQNK